MKRSSLKLTVFLPTLAVLIVGVVIMVIMVSTFASTSTSDLTNQLVTTTVNEYSEKFQTLALGPYSVASALAPVLADIAKNSETPRDDMLDILISVLGADKDIIGVWTGWEANALDGLDSQYVNAEYYDETGRFIPYVYREGDSYGIAALMDYEDPVDGDYIVAARVTGKPHITDPFEYDVGGRMTPMYTISVPILSDNNTVLGVAGIDISLERMIATMNEASILEDGYVFVLSPSGLYASHRDTDLLMKDYKTMWLSNHSADIDWLLSEGGSYSTTDVSDVMQTKVIFSASTVMIGNTGSYWAVCGIVPQSTAYASSNMLTWLVIIVGIALIAVTGLTILLFVSKGLKRMPGITAQAGRIEKGDISNIDINRDTSPTKNEITLLERAFGSISNSIKDQADIMARIADGDYSVSIPVRCDGDVMNQAINDMLNRTNETLHQITESSAQVATGSRQIADGSQALAQGSTEQAASVQQLSSSINEIANKTKDNAEKAGRAAILADTIKENAEKGSRQMDEMMAAVKEINIASQNINKVIKVIDDIAFQTNILALNAAVEAARAGQHGKGFAVVAEEVRNLAAKSAEAAKNTNGLIANSMEKAELGSRIANETAASLSEIVSGINESRQIVHDIALSSNEQTAGIDQINRGIDQVAQVVQQNSATAEESAATSEEMNSQSNLLMELVSQFSLKEELTGRKSLTSAKAYRLPESQAY